MEWSIKYSKEVFFVLLLIFLIYSPVTAQNQISGTVYKKGTGTPLPGTNVFLPSLQKGIATDAEGKYEISGLPSGKFKIQFSFIGYEILIMDVLISDGPVELNVELNPSVFQFQEIVVTGGRPSAQHENAIKIETIDQKAIISVGSPSLMKSIGELPGIDVISKGDAVATPVIRGLSTSNILLLNNGVRLENYQFSENHPFMIDEFGIDKIEIIKGPASLLYGSDAIAGVLNFIKEKPAPVGSIVGDGHLQYYSNTHGWNGNMGLKGTQGKYNWGVRGGAKSHMDYLQGGGDYVPNTRFNQYSAKVFGGYSGKISNYKVNYDYTKMTPGMSVLPAIAEIDERGRKNAIWYQDLDMHLLSTKSCFFINEIKLEANLAWQHNHRKLIGSKTIPDNYVVDTKLNTLNYELKGNYTTSEHSNFILSVQGMSQRNRNGAAPDHVLPDYSLQDISLSGLVQHDFDKVHFQIGLRFDNRFINVPQYMNVSPVAINNQDVEELKQYYGNMSASAGLTYQLTRRLLMRGNLASAYRTPNIAELTQDGVHGIRYEQGNRNLESQRNYEADLGLHYHSDHFLIDFAAFYNSINNYIFLSPTADTTGNGLKIYKYSQHNANIYGFESVVELLATKWFRLKGSYGYIKAAQADGANLPFIPQNKLKMDARMFTDELWRLQHVFIKTGMTLASDQNNPAIFESSTDGYLLFDAAVGATFFIGRQSMNLEIVANNIFDTQYIDHLSTLKDLHYYNPGRGIMVHLSIPLIIFQKRGSETSYY